MKNDNRILYIKIKPNLDKYIIPPPQTYECWFTFNGQEYYSELNKNFGIMLIPDILKAKDICGLQKMINDYIKTRRGVGRMFRFFKRKFIAKEKGQELVFPTEQTKRIYNAINHYNKNKEEKENE